MKRYYNVFPNSKKIASYDPFNQWIDLSSFDAKDFPLGGFAELKTKEQVFKLAVFTHEMTHWFDHIGTLWGQQNLVRLFNALNARATESLSEFWRIKYYYDFCKKDTYNDYFLEQYSSINGSVFQRWKYQITSGIKFNSIGNLDYDRPILMVRFSSHDDKPVVRIPVTIASILETNAIFQEVKAKIAGSNMISDIVEKNIALREFTDDIKNLLYNSSLVLYNVNTHLYANLRRLNDILQALQDSSQIGNFVLNFPDSYYDKIKVIKSGDNSFDDRLPKFISSKDKGFLYYCLINNLVVGAGNKEVTLENLLSSSDLGDSETLDSSIKDEMGKNLNNLIDGPFYNIAKALIEQGIELYKQRGLMGNNSNSFDSFVSMKLKPKLMFGDTLYDDSNFNIIDALDKLKNNQNLDIETEYYLFEFYRKKFDEFINICGI